MNTPGDADAIAFLATLRDVPDEFPGAPPARHVATPDGQEISVASCRALWSAVLRICLVDLERNWLTSDEDHQSAQDFAFGEGEWALHRQWVCAAAEINEWLFVRTARDILDGKASFTRYHLRRRR